jgi:hypothetical protein
MVDLIFAKNHKNVPTVATPWSHTSPWLREDEKSARMFSQPLGRKDI